MNGKDTAGRITGSTTLHDMGGGFFFFYLLLAVGGIFLGLIFDYLWNWLVLTVALWHPRSPADSTAERAVQSVTIGRRMLYAVFITLIGIPINAVYAGLAWSWSWEPRINITFQVLLMVMPIGMLWLANYLLSRYFLKLDKRQAATVAAIMAVLTAPWLMLVIPHL
jgi:hypothetical protein